MHPSKISLKLLFKKNSKSDFFPIEVYPDSKDSFLNEDLAIESVRKRAQKGEVVVPLSKIHEGKIAILAYHDEDSDGKLKTG